MRQSIVVRTAVILAALASLGLVVAYGAERARRRGSTPPTMSFVPDPAIPRLRWERVAPSSVTSVEDFAVVRGRLYLADRLVPHVVALRRDDDGMWSETASLGRAGDGPGEMRAPMGITGFGPDSGLAVLDGRGRLQFFDGAGTHLRSVALALPCAMPSPQIASQRDGAFLVAGDCFGRDTVYAALFRWRAGEPARELLREPKFTRSGSWGSMYASPRPLITTGPDLALFGTGLTDCVAEIGSDTITRHLSIARRCGLIGHAFVAPAPDAVRDIERRRAELRMASSRALQWPDPLPPYVDKIQTTQGLVLVRLFRSDSVVLERADDPAAPAVLVAGVAGIAPVPPAAPFSPVIPVPPSSAVHRVPPVISVSPVPPVAPRAYLLVAPLDGFRGCVADGCLWYIEQRDGERIALVRRSELEARMTAALRSAPRSPPRAPLPVRDVAR